MTFLLFSFEFLHDFQNTLQDTSRPRLGAPGLLCLLWFTEPFLDTPHIFGRVLLWPCLILTYLPRGKTGQPNEGFFSDSLVNFWFLLLIICSKWRIKAWGWIPRFFLTFLGIVGVWPHVRPWTPYFMQKYFKFKTTHSLWTYYLCKSENLKSRKMEIVCTFFRFWVFGISGFWILELF